MSLIVSHLHKKYGQKVVVEDLSFEMQEPGVYALLGTNGAGKTTSIRMMLGMLAKDGGEVLWNGAPLSQENCNIGYLAEERGLYPKYSLMDQLVYFAGLRGVGKKEAEARILELAERLEVMEYLYPQKSEGAGGKRELEGKNGAGGKRELEGKNGAGGKRELEGKNGAGVKKGLFGRKGKAEKPKLADQLSKGNQQKIQFMTALLSDPELIILDEPLSGLDPVNTDIIRTIIQEEIAKGKYLIMSSHQMATVEEFCTDITIMNRAKSVLQGNLNEIKKSYGRVNLHLKVEQDILPYIQACGIQLLSEKAYEYELKVTGDEQANELLASLIQANIPVVTFSLREPSLHEIFVEKVGEAHEQI